MNEGKKQYFVLMIVTDGAITDMQATICQIVELSALPCSIIIIGVGSADFTNMEELDGDDGLLRDKNGRQAKRDIV